MQNVKKTLLLASAALLATLVAAPAMAQSIGSAGAAYVNSQADFDGFEVEGDGAVADISFATPAFGEWTVTGAAQVAYADNDFNDSTALSGSVHMSRNIWGVRAGGFVAASDGGYETLWTVGGQVQKYFDKATLSGVVSYGSVEDLDIWTVGGDAGYYLTPSLRVNAGVAYNSLEFDGSDTEALTYGVGAEYQINRSPFSVYGGWERASIDDADLDIDTVSLGLRFSFGGDLQTRERSGADLGRKLGGVAGAVGFISDAS
ncbi:MAG: hypothetical protein EON87_11580 [Brevundimonas sp.]|nr:MAG: hypothetical protein EON87_11580 [Brevundimonas sp.]